MKDYNKKLVEYSSGLFCFLDVLADEIERGNREVEAMRLELRKRGIYLKNLRKFAERVEDMYFKFLDISINNEQ